MFLWNSKGIIPVMSETDKHGEHEDTTPEDFPEGGITLVSVETDHCITDRICDKCDGVRNSLTYLFRIHTIVVEVRGERMTWDEFCRRHPKTGAVFSDAFGYGIYKDPTCFACQEDMFTRLGQYRGGRMGEGEGGN